MTARFSCRHFLGFGAESPSPRQPATGYKKLNSILEIAQGLLRNGEARTMCRRLGDGGQGCGRQCGCRKGVTTCSRSVSEGRRWRAAWWDGNLVEPWGLEKRKGNHRGASWSSPWPEGPRAAGAQARAARSRFPAHLRRRSPGRACPEGVWLCSWGGTGKHPAGLNGQGGAGPSSFPAAARPRRQGMRRSPASWRLPKAADCSELAV